MEFSVTRILTVMTRYLYSHRYNVSKLFEFFFWPLLDLVLFGFVGVGSASCRDELLISGLMIGLVLWQVVQRANMEISRNLLQELWDNNLMNFLATPLKLSEWIIGLLLMSFLTSIFITIPYGTFLVYSIFGYNVFSLGFLLIPSILLLIMSGWALGFLGASFLIYWGEKIDILVWALPWIPTPFCSILYPVEILPHWMQTVGKCLPMGYVFDGIRFTLRTGIFPYQHLSISLALNIVYLGATLCLFLFMFHKKKKNGF